MLYVALNSLEDLTVLGDMWYCIASTTFTLVWYYGGMVVWWFEHLTSHNTVSALGCECLVLIAIMTTNK